MFRRRFFLLSVVPLMLVAFLVAAQSNLVVRRTICTRTPASLEWPPSASANNLSKHIDGQNLVIRRRDATSIVCKRNGVTLTVLEHPGPLRDAMLSDSGLLLTIDKRHRLRCSDLLAWTEDGDHVDVHRGRFKFASFVPLANTTMAMLVKVNDVYLVDVESGDSQRVLRSKFTLRHVSFSADEQGIRVSALNAAGDTMVKDLSEAIEIPPQD